MSPIEWFQQPAGLLDKMETLLGVYDSHLSWKNRRGKLKDYIQSNPGVFGMIEDIRKLEKALKENDSNS